MAVAPAADPRTPAVAELGRSRAVLYRVSGNVLPLVAASFLGVLVIFAITGSLLAPHDPDAQELGGRLLPTIWQTGGTADHLLGTDQLGRDVLSRLIAGTRITLFIAFGVALIEMIVGSLLGILAGYFGGRFEAVVLRVFDIQLGFPIVLVYIFVVLVFGQALHVVIIGLALVGWITFGAISRVAVKRIRTAAFIESATVAGSTPQRTIRVHVLPQIRGELMTLYLLEVGRVLLAEASMSFLGLGVQPPIITWGLMIGGAQGLLSVTPWLAIIPGLLIVVTVVSLNLVASWVRGLTDAFERRA